VMQTLAHHVEVSEDDSVWIAIMSDVDGLVSLAACHLISHDPVTLAELKELVNSLHRLFETMRQCEADGFIACTLKSAQLTEGRRKEMHAAYLSHIQALREAISSHVMRLVLHHRNVQLDNCGLFGAPAIDVQAPNAVHLTRVIASNVPTAHTDAALRVSFALKPCSEEGQVCEGRTCLTRADAQTEASGLRYAWPDEIVSLQFNTCGKSQNDKEVARKPLELVIHLWAGESLIGTAEASLQKAVGRMHSLQTETVSSGPSPIISFTYRITPWLA
jgi:hypothetical protein